MPLAQRSHSRQHGQVTRPRVSSRAPNITTSTTPITPGPDLAVNAACFGRHLREWFVAQHREDVPRGRRQSQRLSAASGGCRPPSRQSPASISRNGRLSVPAGLSRGWGVILRRWRTRSGLTRRGGHPSGTRVGSSTHHALRSSHPSSRTPLRRCRLLRGRAQLQDSERPRRD